jgi:two-component system OmpR family response regulator
MCMNATPVPAPESSRVQILIANPNQQAMSELSLKLRFQGFATTAVLDGRSFQQRVTDNRPDLAIISVQLPDVNGIGLCRRLRLAGLELGLVLIGGASSTSADKVTGLSYSDDYVTEPYVLDEVVARVRAVLRRTQRTLKEISREDHESHQVVQRYADVELEAHTFQARRAGRTIHVSPTEFRLLSYFLENPHRVLTRAEILRYVWGPNFVGEPTIVDTYVRYLRRKLHVLGPPLIHTRRGFGYLLDTAAEG